MTSPGWIRERALEEVAAGASLRAAGAASGVSVQSVMRWWAKACPMTLDFATGNQERGGLLGPRPADDPTVTSSRRRPLTSADRAVIAAGLMEELPQVVIARMVGRDPSVVSREIRRNTGIDGVYRAPIAHVAAAQRRRRPKEFKLVANVALCRRIEAWMDQGWSPKLIALVLQAESGDHTGRVSHETIYQALYVQTRGSLRADLHRQLSLKRAQRVARKQERNNSPYREAFKISQRPAEASDRAVPGHWEGDLIVGAGSTSAIGTLVERSTRFTVLLHLPDRHDAVTVAEAMIREMGHLPEHLRRSITWDRGTELAGYERIQIALKAPIFFCDPHSPWQRGTNENTNRLLRFWFAKGTDLSVHTAEDLRRVADTLNRRPRPTLGLQTPADKLNQLLTAA